MPPAITGPLATTTVPFGENEFLPIAIGAFLLCALVTVLLTRRSRPRGHDRQERGSAAVATAAVAALVCTAYSADTSWRFAAHYLDMSNTTERTVMFAAAELALFAMALMARQNLHGPRQTAGLPGALIWVITAIQTIPAYAESGPIGGTVRAFTGPVMAAVLWHLAMGIELRQRHSDAASRSLTATLARQARERLLARLGIVEQGQGAAQISRQRAMHRAVALAARLADMPPAQRTGRAARRTVRRLSKALARSGIDADPHLDDRLLRQLATRRQAADLATIDLPPRWTTPTGRAASPPATRHYHPRADVEVRAEDPPRPHPTGPGDEGPRRTTRPDHAARSSPEPAARQGCSPKEQTARSLGERATRSPGEQTRSFREHLPSDGSGTQPGNSAMTKPKQPGRKPRASDKVLRDYAHHLHHETGRLSRDRLEQAVRADGYSIASDHAGDIVRQVKADLHGAAHGDPRL